MKDEMKTNPSCDFILREDAIDLCTRFIEGESRGWVKHAIREVQTALLGFPRGWIPITVAEPNTSDHVLVTYKWGDDDYETSELDYWVNKYEAEHGNERCQFLHDHIIAWQLKPMPYRGGDS
jgi:hypothetical protein